MKPYNERLPMIDEAVEKLQGKWPCGESEAHCYLYKFPHSRYAVGIYPTAVICTRTEFETRAKELGWVNGYKWVVEYTTDGKRPDLPDDVVVDIESPRWEAFGGVNKPIHIWHWPDAEKFKVTDNRYKPKSTSKPQVDNWHELGELPQVASNWEHKNGNVYTVTGYANDKTESDKYPVMIIYQGCNGNVWCRPLSDWFRSFKPIQSERDKVIEAALSQDCDPQEGMLSRKDFCIKLYDAGMLKLPEDV